MDTLLPDYHKNELGSIQIAPEVVEVIAGLATMEVSGVAGMSGGFAGGIAEWLGRKNLAKGVKVDIGEKDVSVDVSIIIRYGHPIPETSSQIQNNVKQQIESMTGLTVTEVNVHVHDVHFGDDKNKDQSDPKELPATDE